MKINAAVVTGERLSGRAAAGDEIPSACEVIELRVDELRQLFNAIDPAPFHRRDLDPKAEEFILGWAEDLPRDTPVARRDRGSRAGQGRRGNSPSETLPAVKVSE